MNFVSIVVLVLLLGVSTVHAGLSGAAWNRVGPLAPNTPPGPGPSHQTMTGPHNIFDAYNDNGKGSLPMGEAGTLAGASSLASKPDIIYAGGQNNGVSSGIIKTVDGGKHWERKSIGIWDTRILGVWIHPDDSYCAFAPGSVLQ